MIPRQAHSTLNRLAKGFPVVALTGPRQAGKTTLAKVTFSGKIYVSLENPDEREFAERDPRGFLQRFPEGAVLDEVQRCPALLSWWQGWVDERQRMGDFVLIGSQQFALTSGMSQTLAGRVGRVELLPFSSGELSAANRQPETLEACLWQGGYPALYEREVGAGRLVCQLCSDLPGAGCQTVASRARPDPVSALCQNVCGAFRTVAQSDGAGCGLRHIRRDCPRVAFRSGSELSGLAAAAFSPEFWKAAGQDAKTLFPRRRVDDVADRGA